MRTQQQQHAFHSLQIPIALLTTSKRQLKCTISNFASLITLRTRRTSKIDTEEKLQQLGFLQDLPEDSQSNLATNPIQNFISWRAVWKGNSVSTPCRVVFDASQATSSGFSLNDLLAKGRNNLNKLQEIVIHWSIHRISIHTDVRKMYNTVKLDPADWCYQRYIWCENLDPEKIPQEKIIKTLIYGVRSSGNQAEYGLRKVAEMSSKNHPEVYQVVKNDIYADDCMSGAPDTPSSHKLTATETGHGNVNCFLQ